MTMRLRKLAKVAKNAYEFFISARNSKVSTKRHDSEVREFAAVYFRISKKLPRIITVRRCTEKDIIIPIRIINPYKSNQVTQIFL